MRRHARLILTLALALATGTASARTIDDFEQTANWKAAASDGVGHEMSWVAGAAGRALRLDYDFTGGSGYAFLRRELPLELPDNFEIRFKLRGQGAANALEMKLVDASGDNVWWHRKADFVPPSEWTTIRVKRRQIEFAWGPSTDKRLRRAAAIEFVVAAGAGGGKGWIAIDDLTIDALPSDPAVPPPIVARGDAGARLAVDGDASTAWAARNGEPLDLDLGYNREFGGLTLQWAAGGHAPDYAISLSADGNIWRNGRSVTGGDGGTDWIKLEESEARFVRIAPVRGAFALAEVRVEPLAFGASDNDFLTAVAKTARRGDYPRGFVGEQNYWTLLATPEGGESGLIDEDGAVEVGRGGFSVEPFVLDGGVLTSWADVAATQTLSETYLPILEVRWIRPGWALDIRAFADTPDRLVARYRLTNSGAAAKDLALVLAVRPHQVNPPQQFLNIRGGVSRIAALSWDGQAVLVDGTPRVRPASPPDEVKLAAFDSGPLPQSLAKAGSAPVVDPTGLASGALVYRVRIAPGESRDFALALATAGQVGGFSLAQAAAAEQRAAAAWRERLGRVELSGPPAARPLLATLRSALAQMLMSRDGPALRPGTRAYARSWIRDGAMMSTALLRLGEAPAASDFLDWYAPFQYPDGKVPCCVDKRGADPVPEHDSDGELIHLITQLHRFTADSNRSRRMWPRVRAAADHIEALRQKTRVPENQTPGRRQFYGLLPPSISHEGYSAKPMHSYWDDFWALAGLKDAAWLASAIGKPAEAALMTARVAAFRADILASLAAAQAVHGIGFIPGAADLGDFDATSTTIALSVAGEQPHLPQPAVAATFDRYWTEFVARRDGANPWDAYTPYEWRNVGAFIRLGWRTRSAQLVDFFMADRRPAGWNQWAEVVGRLPREPRFLGDMPHGWVASDFINAALDMLAFERDSDGALVLAAGVPDDWLAQGGITVERLRTPYGLLSYSLAADRGRVRLRYNLDGKPPPGGLVLGLDPAGHRLRGNSGTAEVDRRTIFRSDPPAKGSTATR